MKPKLRKKIAKLNKHRNWIKRYYDEVLDRHKAMHLKQGSTWAVYFPPDCPWKDYNTMVDTVTDLVYSMERSGWDPFAWGQGGEVKLVPLPKKERFYS